MRDIITLGGDTDTNAAITGGLLGTIMGFNQLQIEQDENLDILVNAPTEEGDFPRPDLYHPKTIPGLAEELTVILT